MKKLLTFIIIAAIIGGLIFAFIEGREEFKRERERESPVKAPSRVEVVRGASVVTLDEAARQQSGVALGKLEAVTHRREVRAFGTVLDTQELTDLRGSLLTATAQLAKAKAALEVTRNEFERQRTLRQQNQNVSEKALQTAEGALRGEEANVAVAEAALNTAQASARQRWGAVVAQWLAADAPELGALQRQEQVLVQISAPSGATLPAAPDTATLQAADGAPIVAKLVSPAPRTDPKIQGRAFFYLAPVKDGALPPGRNVAAALPLGEPVPGVRAPDTAVVWLHGKAWAYAQTEPDRFARREVSTEQPADGGWFQPATFSKGEPFVLQGAQVLLSEEFRAQILIGEEAEGK
jgi:hypothetical protein